METRRHLAVMQLCDAAEEVLVFLHLLYDGRLTMAVGQFLHQGLNFINADLVSSSLFH